MCQCSIEPLSPPFSRRWFMASSVSLMASRLLKQDPTCAAFHYPFQKSLIRVTKYSERGFKFESMQFWPSHSELNVAVFEHVGTPPHVSVTFSK